MRVRLGLAAGLLMVMVGLALILAQPHARGTLHDFLTAVPQHLEALGWWGPVLLGLAYVPACLLFLPGSPLSLLAGFAFGFGTGAIAVSLGSTLGASAAFLTGRLLLRDWIARWLAAYPRFAALDSAVGAQGFQVVLLTRLSPMFPFNLLNYAFGLTRVSFRDYALGSWLGMLPGTVLFVYLGSATKNIADLLAGRIERTPAQQMLFFVGLAATVLVTIVITRAARRALDTALNAKTPPTHAAPAGSSVSPAKDSTRSS